jgi:hypothetical protein
MSGPDTSATAKVVKRRSNPGRGSKPGERRGGRVKGTPNNCSRTLKELAREYTAEALEALVAVLRDGESEQARIQAANAILDRGYGKPSTVLAGDEEGGAVKVLQRIVLEGVMPQ